MVRVRRHKSLKPKTYRERPYVYAAGISVKGVRLTLGGLQAIGEVSRGHSTEPNHRQRRTGPPGLGPLPRRG